MSAPISCGLLLLLVNVALLIISFILLEVSDTSTLDPFVVPDNGMPAVSILLFVVSRYL
ncbi:hypothetical protein D3C79_899570 [compost metagenome]